MENRTEYEKAKAECWSKFYNEELRDRPQWEPIGYSEIFDKAFEYGYKRGVMSCIQKDMGLRPVGMEEAKAQVESASDHIPEDAKKVDRAMIAAMAMQGLLANALWVQKKTELMAQEHGDDIDSCAEALKHEIAEDAVEFADALIAELKKEKG